MGTCGDLNREVFDNAVRSALAQTLQSVGDDCLGSVLSILGGGREAPLETLTTRLGELDSALDDLFNRFAKIIKQVTILQTCARLKLEPPKLGGSLFWMVEELRSNMWKEVH